MRIITTPAKTQKKPDKDYGDLTEGEAARRLLEQHDFLVRRQEHRNGQWEFNCPFHELPGEMEKKKATNFYLNYKTSQYYCQAGSCGERGNLQTLEKYFGIENDPVLSERYKSKDTALKEYQAGLTTTHRRWLLADKGLDDDAIEKFRIGFDKSRDCYVIPYLENRRPTAFRFYDPIVRDHDDKGKALYGGPNGSKYWWEASGDSIVQVDDNVLRLFNPQDANGGDKGEVYICEGEFKAMLLSQMKFPAVSIPGTNGFKPEWARYFMHARTVYIVMDNDNPESHKRDDCRKCAIMGEKSCVGHNPGQEGAAKLLDFFGYRAQNVLLPLPDGERKTDVNEYFMRDKHAINDFVRLVTGKDGSNEYVARTLGEIRNDPPPETVFLVDDLLPVGGRLLVTGAPKVGKSIFVENLVLSIASGIPFLHRFGMANNKLTTGHRVLLLDRELSERSLFDRMNSLIAERPGYAVADDKLLIDHRFQLALDQPGAAEDLIGLIRENNAEVVVLDTAYKFFANGDMESSKSLSKSFAAIDKAIKETGASFILTHHHRKGSNNKGEAPSADSVVGSFLWTGWANGTVLLNFKNRSVSDPYTTIASFASFRDGPAPDPLLLKRDKTSISYTEILPFSFDELDETQSSYAQSSARPKLTYDSLADLLMQAVPVGDNEFLHIASAHFGMKPENIKLQMLDIGDRHPDFIRDGDGSRNKPYTWRYAHDKVEETYDQEMQALLGEQTTIEEMLAA